jgi:hypothetical protein
MEKRRILVIGGYGTFGGRIVRLLARQRRWRIIVAGRSLAEAFARGLNDPDISTVAFDRDRVSEAMLREYQPWLVIDASGPFQGAEVLDYPVVRAALAVGAHYIDIADAPGFVRGIDGFDAAAKERGVTLISGASSVPALSSAVVAELAKGLDEILEVEIAISSSNQATLGRSVHAGLLSYAGKPIRVRRYGLWTEATALADWQAIDFALPDRPKLRHRLVATCEVPDLELLPALYPSLRKAMFRAGTELAMLNRGAGLLARLVSWHVLRSGTRLTGPAIQVFNLLRGFGSTRSGMAVDVRGRRRGEFLARRWTVLAEKGDGLWVPAMAAALLTDKLDRGALAPGAQAGVGLLSLAEFQSAFTGHEIHDGIGEIIMAESPFRQWVGERVASLPPAIRAIHEDPLERSASGSVTVTRGTHPIAARLCRLLGFPESAEDRPLLVEFAPSGRDEIWRRRFTGATFTSRLRPWPGRPGHMRECVGPLAYGFELMVDATGLEMKFRRWWFCGIPLPQALGPRVAARQWQEGADYCFSVDVAAPGIGRVVAYRGRLRLNPADDRNAGVRKDGSAAGGEGARTAASGAIAIS